MRIRRESVIACSPPAPPYVSTRTGRTRWRRSASSGGTRDRRGDPGRRHCRRAGGLIRNTGKLAFATLREGIGTRLRVMLRPGRVGEDALAYAWKADVDLGDHVAVTGRVISRHANLGDGQSVDPWRARRCARCRCCTKELSEESRVRQRYADLIVRQGPAT